MAILNKSLNEYSYDYMELYRANHKDTDSLDIDQIKHWIDSTRNILLKQRLDRNPFMIDTSWLQTVSIEGSSDTYFESTEEIPTPINRRGGIGAITRIDSGTLFDDNIEFKHYEEAKAFNNGKFDSATKYAFIWKDKFFVKNETSAESFEVTGVWQNPRLIATFAGLENFDKNYTYPMDQSLVVQMKEIITKANFSFILQQLEDKVADGTDSTTNIK